MRKLRGLFADAGILISTAGFGVLSLLLSPFDPTGEKMHRLAQVWAASVLWLPGVRVRVEGLELIDPACGYVFVANHLSYMDTPVVMSNIRVQFRFLAKRGLFQIPLLGGHLKRAGHVPVPREDPRAAVKTMATAAEVIQQKKVSLLIFPEGGRSHNGVLRPFKEGAAYIAIKAGAPIVPVALIGTREVLPYGGGIVQSGHVTIRILQPIPTAGMALKDRGRVTEQIRELILAEAAGHVTMNGEARVASGPSA